MVPQACSMYMKRTINKETPVARLYNLGDGRFALNAPEGIACTLTGAHHFAGNITHPRQGFREMGILEVYEILEDTTSDEERVH